MMDRGYWASFREQESASVLMNACLPFTFAFEFMITVLRL